MFIVKQKIQYLWTHWHFYIPATILFIVFRLPLFLLSDATIYYEDYSRGQIALDILQHDFASWSFLFADDYALGSFFSGLWIAPFFMLFGKTFLAQKIAALSFSTVAFILWIRLFSKTIDLNTGRVLGILLIFSPPILQRFQLINMGFHAESFMFLPLTFMLALSVITPQSNKSKGVLVGILFGLFSAYCLTNTIAVALSICLITYDFIVCRRFNAMLSLFSGTVLGFSPWVYLKFNSLDAGKIFSVMNTGEKSIINILKSFWKLLYVFLPQSILSFTEKPPMLIIICILISVLIIYALAFYSWKTGLLAKCLLLYPLAFICLYLLINPDRGVAWNTYLDLVRLFVPLVYVLLALLALSFKTVLQHLPHWRKLFIVYMVFCCSIFMLNLWTNICKNYPIHWTKYAHEPGYMPLYRNLSTIVKYVNNTGHFTSSNRLSQLCNLLNNLEINSFYNAQLFYVVGDYIGRNMFYWESDIIYFEGLIKFISKFDSQKRNLFLQGLAFGSNSWNDIYKNKTNFNLLHKFLAPDDWKSFNVGLINTCFRLENPSLLRDMLMQWAAVYNLPVLVPDPGIINFLDKYYDQISVLSFSCMTTPGALRGYVHMFKKDPVALRLLGWWLARDIAPDTEWLVLKLGPDFHDCNQYIFEGMSAFIDSIPFINFFYATELMLYTTGKSQNEFNKNIRWAPNKRIFPGGGLVKNTIAECNVMLKRGWD